MIAALMGVLMDGGMQVSAGSVPVGMFPLA